ncbi:MAG: YncE family protein, partial [Verrucomicrobia bacterium]|nr:YncE family protein [Verrucomicrobiota bacterium]
MNPRTVVITAGCALAAIGSALGLGGRAWAIAHVRRWTGRPTLGFVSCDHCHGVSLERLPWAKSRPHHPSPAGLAISPDGAKLYVALYDLDQVVEVEVKSRAVRRRVPVPGRPTGLVLSPRTHRLYVTCRDADRLVALDTETLRELETVQTGRGPVGLARCLTAAGERLVVANSMSDDVSLLATAPLRELTRLAAGREPFAVASAPDGTRAWVANRLATTRRQDSVPASELTVIDPGPARVVDRLRLESAHLSEGVCVVAGRKWTLLPLVKVRNLVPITQVANGWVMSSGFAIAGPGGLIQMPLDEANDYFADPSGIAADATGGRAFIASGGGDVISVVDLGKLAAWLRRSNQATRDDAIEDLALSPKYVIARLP